MPVYTKQPNMVFATLQEDLTDDGNETPGLTPTYIRLTEAKTTDFPAEGYILVADDKAKVPGDTVWALYEYTGKADQSGGSTNDSLTNLSRAEAVNRNFSSSHTFTSGEADVVLADSADQLNDLLDIINGNTAFPNGVDLGDNPAQNVATPTNPKDAANKEYVDYQNSILGIEFNQTQDTWNRIDRNGNQVNVTTGELQEYPLFSEVTRVILDSSGNEVAQWGDDDYSHAPTDKFHNVFARFGKRWQRREVVTEGGDRIFRWWLANYSASGFSLNPTFKYGGSERQYAYIGAYNACAYSDDGGTTWYLGSRSGVTPAHGNGDYSGLNGNTLSNFDIEEARQYAQNIGTGFQLYLPWTRGLYTLMNLIYWGEPDLQSLLGRGVVDLASGTGYAGKDTGADSIDSQIDNPTLVGTGTGADGETPICSLGVSSPYGLIWEFIDGYEAVDAEYRILSRDGFSVIGPPNWTSSDYEFSSASPLTDDDGYIDDLEGESLLNLLFIPKSTAGSDSTYIPDYFWSHDSGENNILLSGGGWPDGSAAGLGCLGSNGGVGLSARANGARIEYLG